MVLKSSPVQVKDMIIDAFKLDAGQHIFPIINKGIID